MGITNNSGISSQNVVRLVGQSQEGRQSGQASRKFRGRAISTSSVDSGFIDLKSKASSRSSLQTSLSSRSLTTIEPKQNYIKKETSGSATLNKIFHKALSSSDPNEVSRGITEFLSTIRDECKSKGYSSEHKPSSKESSKKYNQLVEMVAHESLLTQTLKIGEKTSTIDQVVQHSMDIVQSQRLIKMHDYRMRRSFASNLIQVGRFSKEDQQLIYDVGLNLDCFYADEHVEQRNKTEAQFKKLKKEMNKTDKPDDELVRQFESAGEKLRKKSKSVTRLLSKEGIKDYGNVYNDLVRKTEEKTRLKIEDLIKNGKDKGVRALFSNNSTAWVGKATQRIEKHARKTAGEMNEKLKSRSGGGDSIVREYRESVLKVLADQQYDMNVRTSGSLNESGVVCMKDILSWEQSVAEKLPYSKRGILLDSFRRDVLRLVDKMERRNFAVYKKYPSIQCVLQEKLSKSIKEAIDNDLTKFKRASLPPKKLEGKLLKELSQIIDQHTLKKKGKFANVNLGGLAVRFDLKWLSGK